MTLKKLPTVGTRLTHSWVKWVTKPIFRVGPNFASILSVNLIFVYIVERYAYCLYVYLCSVITVHWEVTRECRMLPAVSALALLYNYPEKLDTGYKRKIIDQILLLWND